MLALLYGGSATGADRPDRDWHAGINFRTDFGTHPIRVDGGVRSGSLDGILILDPMFWTDGQHDIDLILDWRFSPAGWSAQLGWRATVIGIAGGHQWQEKSLLAIAGRLPVLWEGLIRQQVGLECSLLWLKHGAGLPSQGTDFSSGREFVDHLNFAIFWRMELARAF